MDPENKCRHWMGTVKEGHEFDSRYRISAEDWNACEQEIIKGERFCQYHLDFFARINPIVQELETFLKGMYGEDD